MSSEQCDVVVCGLGGAGAMAAIAAAESGAHVIVVERTAQDCLDICPEFGIGDLEVDTVSRTVSRGGRPIDLQRREFLLLERLARHAGQVVTRSMLLETAWNYDFEPHGNIVDRHIHRLRQKIDDGFPSRLIHTVAGAGYTIRLTESAD